MSVRVIHVLDSMQDYTYTCTDPIGKNFDPDFTPDLTPAQMLELGIFGGNYTGYDYKEFPSEWLLHVRLAGTAEPKNNYFEVNASQPLSVWQHKGWIYADDPRGWFQWYCRYYLGRRLPQEDERQIKRWKAIRRHVGQLKKYCMAGDETCRPGQRQALLHWAYDSRKL